MRDVPIFWGLKLVASEFLDPSPTSPLRHSSYSHAFTKPLLPSKVRRIVAWLGGTQAADGKARVERKSRPRSRSRLIQRAEQAQGGG